jgi:hypothetical protein
MAIPTKQKVKLMVEMNDGEKNAKSYTRQIHSFTIFYYLEQKQFIKGHLFNTAAATMFDGIPNIHPDPSSRSRPCKGVSDRICIYQYMPQMYTSGVRGSSNWLGFSETELHDQIG